MTMYRIHGAGAAKDLGGSVSADEAVAYLQRQLDTVFDLQRQLAEREAELAALVHPFDLEKYRSSK